jgi:hypothetical protein
VTGRASLLRHYHGLCSMRKGNDKLRKGAGQDMRLAWCTWPNIECSEHAHWNELAVIVTRDFGTVMMNERLRSITAGSLLAC